MSVLRLTTDHKAARNAATLAWLDAGAGNAYLELYAPPGPPSAPEAAVEAEPMARVDLQKPAGVMVGAAISLQAAGDGMALLTGEVGWARLVTAAGHVAADGAVSDADGNAPFKLSSVQLYRGGVVRLLLAVMG